MEVKLISTKRELKKFVYSQFPYVAAEKEKTANLLFRHYFKKLSGAVLSKRNVFAVAVRDGGQIKAQTLFYFENDKHCGDCPTCYFCYFYCEDSVATAQLLFESVFLQMKKYGVSRLKGPVCTFNPFNGDGCPIFGEEKFFFRQPPYYRQLFEEMGFGKYKDVFTVAFRNEALKDELPEGIAAEPFRTSKCAQIKDLVSIADKDKYEESTVSISETFLNGYPELLGMLRKPNVMLLLKDELSHPVGFGAGGFEDTLGKRKRIFARRKEEDSADRSTFHVLALCCKQTYLQKDMFYVILEQMRRRIPSSCEKIVLHKIAENAFTELEMAERLHAEVTAVHRIYEKTVK